LLNDHGVDDKAFATGYTMQAIPGAPDFKKIALKWHDLAERRLDYYTELYRSGRWRHYYTQERFAIRMLEVIDIAKTWRELAGLPREKRPEPVAQAKDSSLDNKVSAGKVSASKISDSKTPPSPARRAGEMRSAA
jgi:uncharacterized repeat protein (TIGR03809 family)